MQKGKRRFQGAEKSEAEAGYARRFHFQSFAASRRLGGELRFVLTCVHPCATKMKLLSFFLAAAAMLPAQSIQYSEARKVWLLTTRQSSYAMGVGPDGALRNLYWGAPLWRIDDLAAPRRAPRHLLLRPPPDDRERGISRLGRPALLRARAQNLTRGWRPRPGAAIRLAPHPRQRPRHRPERHPRRHRGHPALPRLPGLRHHPPLRHHSQRHRPAAHRRERAVRRLVPAARRRLPAHATSPAAGRPKRSSTASPSTKARRCWRAARATPATTSTRGSPSTQATPPRRHGRVWFGALGWSGNWRIAVEQTAYRQVRVTGGFNTFDFSYPLAARREPRNAALLRRLLAVDGFGGASRAACIVSSASRFFPAASSRACARCSTTPGKPPPSTSTRPGQKPLADKAAKLGVELFVMDDGWFGKRNNDHAGLGDWVVNPQKFPQRPQAADRSRQLARHGFRPVGRAGNGEPR